jgi:putative transposase
MAAVKDNTPRFTEKRAKAPGSLTSPCKRKDHAVKLARCVIKSNDLVAYEDLRVKNMVKNHCLAKSINEAER